ncbi:caspase domain-containing protein [Armillaria borealis]|uniref:Caspase domain-containing protein n=1 Tax=Armillaria borealis TaxID=47425 RepID=A0AA39J0R6_9AGAR|nr:caspase domain-containing protein [Armillaria borealis]
MRCLLSTVTQVLSSVSFPLVPSHDPRRPDPQPNAEWQANPDALSPVRKAVLIGIKYAHGPPSMRVSGAHEDVHSMKRLLTALYGFRPEDITVLMDNDEVEDICKPTKENITRELRALVQDAQPGGAYFVLFAGHCEQLEEPESETGEYEEEDRLNECLVPMNAVRQQESEADCLDEKNLIVDDEVKSLLVDPIVEVPKARLTTLFDCCHSGTVLDLCHQRCNRTYNLKSKYRRMRRRLNEAFPESGKTILALIEPWMTLALNQLYISIPATMKHTKFCDGYCPRINHPEKGNVLCISACKDSQFAFGNREGGSLTRMTIDRDSFKAFVKALGEAPSLELFRCSLLIFSWFILSRERLSSGTQGLVPKHQRWCILAASWQKPQFSSISPLNMSEAFVLQE